MRGEPGSGSSDPDPSRNLRNSQVSRIVLLSSLIALIVAHICVFLDPNKRLNLFASIILQVISADTLWSGEFGLTSSFIFSRTPLERPAQVRGILALTRLTIYYLDA